MREGYVYTWECLSGRKGGGVPTLDREGVPTLDGGVPTLDEGYLPWTGEVPTLDWGGTYPGWGVPTLNGERIPTLDRGIPTYRRVWTGYAVGGTPLAASHRRTFLSLTL